MALLLLRDRIASQVEYSSSNWALSFHLEAASSGSTILTRTLNNVPFKAGNRLRICTKDPYFVYILVKGIELFRHPANPEFEHPTYTNITGGFTYIPHGNGNVYVTGQRYAVGRHLEGEPDEDWEQPFPNFSIWLNKRNGGLRPDRDRTALSEHQVVEKVFAPIVATMPDHDLVRVIRFVQPIWGQARDLNALDSDPPTAIDILISEARSRGLWLQFPDNCLAKVAESVREVSSNEEQLLKRCGYNLYPQAFAGIGMPYYDDTFTHRMIERVSRLTPEESRRIAILKETLRLMNGELFKGSLIRRLGMPVLREPDIQKPVYLFHAGSTPVFSNRSVLYTKECLYWDRRSLRAAAYEEAITEFAAAHMLKYGSPESEVTSYALTDLIQGAISMARRGDSQRLMGLLRSLWDGGFE